MKEYWFKHHGKASTDPRMKLLKETFGYAGIGVYWEVVEHIETWGDGQFPLKDLVNTIRSPRVPEKMLRSILDDFFLFDRNEFNDVVRSDIPVGECMSWTLEELLRRRRRAEEELEDQRRRFEARQKWLPLDALPTQNINPP